ncbi:hypothetical protein D3C80_781390 [compost metagenome]
MVALDDHVHALHHVTLRITLEGDDALEAQNVGAVCLGDLLDPREEPLGVHLTAAQRDRLHRHVMDRGGRAMVVVIVPMVVMPVIVVMVMMMVVVVMMIAIGAAGMILMAVLEEMRIVFQRALQIEGALIENPGKINTGTGGLVDARGRVDGAHDILDAGHFLRRNEIGLVDDDDIGKGDLVFSLAAVLQAQRQVLGIDQRHNGVKLGLGAHIVIHEEGLGDGHRIGKACRLDDDAVETAGAAHQAFHDADQIAAHRAAHAAIVHFVDFFIRLDDQIVVDADLAEFIDDDSVFLAVVLGENAVEKRRFAGAEISRQDGDWNGLGWCCFGHGKPRVERGYQASGRCVVVHIGATPWQFKEILAEFGHVTQILL